MEPADLEALAVGDAERELDSRLVLARRCSGRGGGGGLPEEQRTVLLLVVREGQSYKAAADVLEIPLGRDDPASARRAGRSAGTGRRMRITTASQAKDDGDDQAAETNGWRACWWLCRQPAQPAQMRRSKRSSGRIRRRRTIVAVPGAAPDAVKAASTSRSMEPVRARLLAAAGATDWRCDRRQRRALDCPQVPAQSSDDRGDGGVGGGARDRLRRRLLAGRTGRRPSPGGRAGGRIGDRPVSGGPLSGLGRQQPGVEISYVDAADGRQGAVTVVVRSRRRRRKLP